MPADDAGRLVAETWLAEHHKTVDTITNEDNAAFCFKVITRYYQVVSAAIRRNDPNHLFIGSRFHGFVLVQDETYSACGPFVDVVSSILLRTLDPQTR